MRIKLPGPEPISEAFVVIEVSFTAFLHAGGVCRGHGGSDDRNEFTIDVLLGVVDLGFGRLRFIFEDCFVHTQLLL